ncbi:hypothetical protein Btru_063318, partial [Bulinus truncatus]
MLIMIVIVLSISIAGCTQIFSENTDSVLISCSPKNFSKSLNFNLVIGNNSRTVLSCYKANMPCYTPQGWIVVFNSTGYYLPFKDNDLVIRRSISGIKCTYISENMTEEYEDLHFIAKPQDVSCAFSPLTYYNKTLSLECSTKKVFPQANCWFSQTDGISGVITESHIGYVDVVPYYESHFTWTSILIDLVAGNYSFDVSFYPNITHDANYAVDLKPSPFLQLTLPNLAFSRECFNGPNIVEGYIKPGATVSCTCLMENTGYPPCSVQWSNSTNQDIGKYMNDTAAEISISPFHGLSTYYCNRLSKLKNGNYSILYNVTYAEGPSSCQVKVENVTQTVWKICDNESIDVSISCEVNSSDVNPGFNAIIYINGDGWNVGESQRVNIMQITKHKITIKQAGNHTVGCYAENSKFNASNTFCNYTQVLLIKGPPKQAPLIKILSNTVEMGATVTENQTYVIECTAPGGIPEVSNVTVSCGNISQLSQSGNKLKSFVTFTRNMTGIKCTCIAEHITGCYENKTAQLKMNVKYMSAVTSFNTNSTVVLENGTWINLFCEADGNPAPLIQILRQKELLSQDTNISYLFINKLMTCEDTGNYICLAQNEVNIVELQHLSTKNITLFVKCRLQLNNTKDFQTFKIHSGQIFSYHLSVYGFPAPSNFTVLKSGRVTNNLTVTYSATEPPYGTIELKIFNVTSSDFDNYTLIMFQNGSQSLNYNFYITEADDDISTSKTEINIGAAVGGSIAAVIVIILIIMAVLFNRKYTIIIQKKSSIEN